MLTNTLSCKLLWACCDKCIVVFSLVFVVSSRPQEKPTGWVAKRESYFSFDVNHDFLFFFCDCGSAEKLLRPPNAIIPFPLSESNLSGPFCYPASSQIASSPVNAFILSPPCLCSDTLPSSDSIKNHNLSSWGSDQIGRLMHFSCVLNFFSQCTSYLHIDWAFISLHFKADSL